MIVLVQNVIYNATATITTTTAAAAVYFSASVDSLSVRMSLLLRAAQRHMVVIHSRGRRTAATGAATVTRAQQFTAAATKD
jgi:hypothetical protein